MAHVEKFSYGSCRAILEHDERSKSSSQYKNIDIDNSRTHLNYSLIDSNLSAMERLEKRLSEIHVQGRTEDGKVGRKDINVIASWIVTLPADLKETPKEKQDEFFKHTYDFLKDRYGEKNVVCADVHNDETTPHLHFCFVPVVENKKTYKSKSKKPKFAEKLSAKEVLTMVDLKSFHDDLDLYIAQHLGQKTAIQTGITKAQGKNKTINELKTETKRALTTERNQALKETQQICDSKVKEASQEAWDIVKHSMDTTNQTYRELEILEKKLEAGKKMADAQEKSYFANLQADRSDLYLSPDVKVFEKTKKGFMNFIKQEKEEMVTLPKSKVDNLLKMAQVSYSQRDRENKQKSAIQEYKDLPTIQKLEQANMDLKHDIEKLQNRNQELEKENRVYKTVLSWLQKKIPDLTNYISKATDFVLKYFRQYNSSSDRYTPERYIDACFENEKREQEKLMRKSSFRR